MMMTSNQMAQDDTPPSLNGVPSLSSPTSAYTLPRRKNSILADTEVSDIMDYETFPGLNESRGGDHRQASSPSSPSPSVPWFIDYWSASFFRTPALVMDNLCACSGSSSMVNDDDDETYGTTTTTKAAGRRVKTHSSKNKSKLSKNITALDDSFRFDISDRSTSVRQWRLRQVVASHDGSLNDDGFYDYSSNTRNKLSSSWTPTMIPGGGSMDKRQAKRPASDPTDEDWPSIRKATMVYDKNDHNNNVTPFRDGPDPLKPSGSSLDLYSTRMLYTCDSFGYMTPSFEHQDADETDERRQASFSFSSSSRRVPMDDDGRETTMTMTMSQPPTASTRRYQPVPTMTAATTAPSSPGNETVTTVSLTQSYMREFEDDDDDTDSNSDSDQEEEDSRYMDGGIRRRRYDNGRTVILRHQQQSPFRDHPTPSMMDNLDEDEEDGNDDENDRNNDGNHDDDASATSATFVPTKAYKYLIRMKPQNYIHYKVVDETDYSDGGSGGGVEEEKKDDDGDMVDFGRSNVEKPYGQRRRQTSTSSSSSSSALPFRIQSVPSSCSSNNSCSQPHEGDEYNDDDAVFVASTVPPCMPEF